MIDRSHVGTDGIVRGYLVCTERLREPHMRLRRAVPTSQTYAITRLVSYPLIVQDAHESMLPNHVGSEHVHSLKNSAVLVQSQ